MLTVNTNSGTSYTLRRRAGRNLALTKSGANTLTLSGTSNTYSGTTRLAPARYAGCQQYLPTASRIGPHRRHVGHGRL